MSEVESNSRPPLNQAHLKVFTPPVFLEGFDLESALRRLRGKWHMLSTLILTFAEDHEHIDQKIQSLIDAGNFGELERVVHQIKGSGANLGATALSTVAADIEDTLKLGQTDVPKNLINKFSDEIKNLTRNALLLKEALDKQTNDEAIKIDKPLNDEVQACDRHPIVVVDDSPHNLDIMRGALSDNFDVTVASCADEALQILPEKPNINIVLLDVSMPGIDGYEACRLLKSDQNLSNIDVIFLSANDSTAEIIQGLEVGAADYVVKPFDPEILISKLNTTIESSKKRVQLVQQAEEAGKLVHAIMSESGSLGVVVNFMRTTFSLKSTKELIDATVDAFEQNGIEAIVYFSVDDIEEVESNCGLPTMLELELLSRMKTCTEPFIEQKGMLFAIQKNVVVLIKNMPADESKQGSVKDSTMIILEGANAKLSYLAEQSTASRKKAEEMGKVVMTAKIALDDIEAKQEGHKKTSMAILDDMASRMEESYFSMGLTDTQEQELHQIVADTVNKSLNHFESGLEVDRKFKQIIATLTTAAQKAYR